MRIGLLGGSFDPVHVGHLKLATSAVRQLKLDFLYLVLSPQNPFKMKVQKSPVSRRLRWLKSAIRGKRFLRIGTFELNRPGPSYTVNTLAHVKRRHPQDELFLVMGSDSWDGFSKWKNPQKIQSLATLVVGRRPGAARVKKQPPLRPPLVLRGIFPNLSSTMIRRRIAEGQSVRGLVPPPVAALRRHG